MNRLIAALLIAAPALTIAVVSAGGALAQDRLDKIVKVGSLGDQSGLYQDIGGPGSSVAAQMAIEAAEKDLRAGLPANQVARAALFRSFIAQLGSAKQ